MVTGGLKTAEISVREPSLTSQRDRLSSSTEYRYRPSLKNEPATSECFGFAGPAQLDENQTPGRRTRKHQNTSTVDHVCLVLTQTAHGDSFVI